MSSACRATTEMIAYKKRIHLSILTVAFCLFPCMVHAQKVAIARLSDDSANHGNDAGLLLGLYFPNQRSVSWHELAGGKWVPEPDSSSVLQARYLTFWISHAGGKVNIQTFDGLIVPRTKGFWHVGTQLLKATQKIELAGAVVDDPTFEEQVWAVPAGTQPAPAKLDPELEGNLSKSVRLISYVGPQYLAFVEHVDGGPGKFEYVNPRVVSLERLDREWELPLEKVVRPSAVREYEQLAKSLDHVSDGPGEDVCACCTGYPKEWGIRHAGLSWEAYVIFREATSSSCSTNAHEYELRAPLPKSLVSGGSLDKSWDELRRQVAAVLHASPDTVEHFFVSPKQDLLIALTDDGIAVLTTNGSEIASVLKVEKFQSPCIPVMEQWATGWYVGAWEETVGKERSASVPPKPTP
jgi:hypothetical protein